MPSQTSHASAIRAGGYSSRVAVSAYVGEMRAQGTLTADPASPYTSLAVTYTTGAYTDVPRGFEVTFSNPITGAFKGRTHVAFSSIALDATTLPVREFATSKYPIVSGDVFTVWNDIRIHDKLVAATDQFQPDYLDYSDEGSAPPPVACSGGHWAGNVDGIGTAAQQTYATVQRTGSTSYTVDPDSNPAHLAHLWTLPTGVAFAPGSVNTDADPALQANVNPHGWLIQHDVTDTDNSKTTTQWTKVMVHDQVSVPYHVLWTPDSATTDNTTKAADMGGGTWEVLAGATDLTSLPDGSTVIVWTQETVAGQFVSYRNSAPGSAQLLSVGVLRHDKSGFDKTRNTITFTLQTVLARLKELTSYSKAMIDSATPDAWDKLETLYVKRGAIQIHQFYTTTTEAGYDWIYDSGFLDKRYPAFYLQRSDFVGQLHELVNGVDARYSCDRTGRLTCATFPPYIPLADRAAVTKTWHFKPADVLDYTFDREHVDTVELYKTNGFTAGATNNQPIFALYPGVAPGEGVATPTKARLITDDDGGAEFVARTGRYGGEADDIFIDSDGTLWRAGPLVLTLRGVYNFFDFSKEFSDFSETLADKRGIDLTGLLFYLTALENTYDDQGDAATKATFKVATNAGAGTLYFPPASTLPIVTVPAPAPITQLLSPLIPVSGQIPQQALAFAATEAKCTLYANITLGVGAASRTPKNTGLSGLVSAYYSDPFSYDAGFAFSPGGVDDAAHLGAAFSGWVNKQSLTGLFGAVGATGVLCAHGNFQVNGWGMACSADAAYRSVTWNNWQTCTAYTRGYFTFAICPHNANRLYGAYISGSTVFIDKSTDGGVTFAPWSSFVCGAHGVALTLDISYLRKDDTPNTDDSRLFMTVAVNLQFGGFSAASVVESADQGLTFPTDINAASGTYWSYDDDHGFTRHTWDANRILWSQFSAFGVVGSVVSNDDFATVFANVPSVLNGSNASLVATGMNGWPAVGTGDPTVGYWIVFGHVFSGAASAFGGVAVSGDNGQTWTLLSDPSWANPGCTYAEYRLATVQR